MTYLFFHYFPLTVFFPPPRPCLGFQDFASEGLCTPLPSVQGRESAENHLFLPYAISFSGALFLHSFYYWDALAMSSYPFSLPPLSVAEGQSLAVCLSCALLMPDRPSWWGFLSFQRIFYKWEYHISYQTGLLLAFKTKPMINDYKTEFYLRGKVLVAQSCLTVCDPMDCSPPGSSVHGILQAKIWEWVVIPFSRGSFQPRD